MRRVFFAASTWLVVGWSVSMRARDGGVLSWNDEHALTKQGGVIARYAPTRDDVVVVRNLRRLLKEAADPDGKDFSVCFSPPRVRPPSPEVNARVRSHADLFKAFDKPAWALAIITHESGGDPNAISPTGCIGLAAFCESDRPQNCCHADRGDRAKGVYDLCNSELERGYHCAIGDDDRFDPRVSASRLIERLSLIDRRARRWGKAAVPERLVPMIYNAGLGCFPEAPSRMKNIPEIMTQLDLTVEPYAQWNRRSLANKAIEVYDYLHWFPQLVRHYREEKIEAPDGGELICFHNSPRASKRLEVFSADSLPRALIAQTMLPLGVRRLQFGQYVEDQVYYVPGAWEN